MEIQLQEYLPDIGNKLPNIVQPLRELSLKDKLAQALLNNNVKNNVDYNNQLINDLTQTQAFQNLQATQPENPYLVDDVMNGLNKGNQEIAQWQANNNIRIPKTQTEIDLANAHQFNLPSDINAMQKQTQAPIIQSGVADKTKFWDEFLAGYKDNYENPIASANFERNHEKTWQNRLGEGLGTAMRFVDSPLGRGLLAGALMSMAGVNGGLALGGGVAAGAGYQNSRAADKLYRNQLDSMGIDTSGVVGNINAEQFRQLMAMQQLKDNADYRNLYLSTQQAQNEAINGLRRDQAEWQKEYQKGLLQDKIDQRIFQANENAANRAITARGQDITRQNALDNLAINADKNPNNAKKAELGAITNQLSEFEKTFGVMPSKLNAMTAGKIRQKIGTQTAGESEFNTRSTLLFNTIARTLGGEKGVLSDQDIQRVKEGMPQLTDSLEQKRAKMKAIKDLLEIRSQQYGISTTQNKPNTNHNETQKVGKYKVRVK